MFRHNLKLAAALFLLTCIVGIPSVSEATSPTFYTYQNTLPSTTTAGCGGAVFSHGSLYCQQVALSSFSACVGNTQYMTVTLAFQVTAGGNTYIAPSSAIAQIFQPVTWDSINIYVSAVQGSLSFALLIACW
jgi:hypothetical protein